ncbi:MAG: hypothetical protein MUC88_06845 [Planctomycetes bacterium]|jgi:hypothetical protein|nr:hypothetical protein [Planctomycetota bacterium]
MMEAGQGLDRRHFLAAAGLTGAAALFPWATAVPGELSAPRKQGATVRAVFLYPPSETFAGKPDGWWSWPGNEFDTEGRQKQYMTALADMEKRLGMKILTENRSVANNAGAQQVIRELETSPPDGLLLIMFYNVSLPQADLFLAAAQKLKLPVIFYVGLGVKHGPITAYRRPGVYFIQSLENLGAIEAGMRMLNTRKYLKQSLILSINEAEKPRAETEPFLGVKVRVIPFSRYAERFHQVELTPADQSLMKDFTRKATENRGVTEEGFQNALRAHLALSALLRDEQADGLTMNCLRRGMLKPCVSFMLLNNTLTPAICENDLPAAYTQLLGQYLIGRPGFQHNPCYETEKNHYYASHCTCPTKVYGPNGPELPYLVRRYAHSNEGSCAVQIFWKAGDPVTMVRYYPGEKPALDVYAGRVVVSHPMPPAGGCTTNVEIEITDRTDACMVKGHHNLLFCGDFARQFRLFAQLYQMELAQTGYQGPWPL